MWVLSQKTVLDFIGTPEYFEHKNKRFRGEDEKDLTKNPAFYLPDAKVRKLYREEYELKSALYFGRQPKFEDIMTKLSQYLEAL